MSLLQSWPAWGLIVEYTVGTVPTVYTMGQALRESLETYCNLTNPNFLRIGMITLGE